jgi:hypothetical protein
MSEIEKLWVEAEGFSRLGRDDLAQDSLAKADQLVADRKAARRSGRAAKKAEIKARLESVDPARFTAIAEIRRDFPEWKGQTVDRAAYVVMAASQHAWDRWQSHHGDIEDGMPLRSFIEAAILYGIQHERIRAANAEHDAKLFEVILG